MSYYYSYTLTHSGLGRSRTLKAATRSELQQKVDAQSRIWDDMYARRCDADARRQAKTDKADQLEDALQEAEARTTEAQKILASIRSTLTSGLGSKLTFSWDDPKNHIPYRLPRPEVVYQQYPPKPQQSDPQFAPQFGLLDKLVGPLRDKKLEEAQRLFQDASSNWKNTCAKISQSNDAIEKDYLARTEKWKSDKQSHEQAQAAAIAATDLKTQRYMAASASEVVEYNTRILNISSYPDFFDKSFELNYSEAKRVLVVNYDLPAVTDFPRLESVKYVKTKDTFTESNLSNREVAELYSGFAFQVCLRTIYELFQADAALVIGGIAFNGYVSATNPATGNIDQTCVLAVRVHPTSFASLNLAKVNPEECFKGLGGHSSAPLESHRPVAPAGAEEKELENTSARWIAQLKQQVVDAGGTLVLAVKTLQQSADMMRGKRANLNESQDLATLLAQGGLCVEPDSSVWVQSYRPTDAVAIYVPKDATELSPSEAYRGAAAILGMYGLVAIADGHINTDEVERGYQCVEGALKLSSGDKQRFESLLRALLVSGDCLWRALPKVINQLKPDFKEWAVEVAVYVGSNNGALGAAEHRVLDKIFPIIDLPVETANRIIAKYTAAPSEVTVLHADPQIAGEPIASKTSGLNLDMNRVAAIARETNEIVSKLSDFMEDKEAKGTQPATTIPPVATTSIPGLNPTYTPVYQELISQPQWAKADFDNLAIKYNLMPVAVRDTINTWSDDALGDFLIDGEDPVTIRTDLISHIP